MGAAPKLARLAAHEETLTGTTGYMSPSKAALRPAVHENAAGDLTAARRVLSYASEALNTLSASLDDDFTRAIGMILAAKGRVIVSGMGKSGHVARKTAATLSSTGTPAYFIHPAEASHGDMGAITRADVLLLLSWGGETAELSALLTYAKRYRIPVIGIGSSTYGITLNGAAQQNQSEVFRWAWDNTLTYNKSFGLHSLNVVVGTSALQENLSFSYEYGTGFASNNVQTLNSASSQLALNTTRYAWSTNSYFGRLTYAYNDKYLLTATLRADGSSRVGTNNRWGTFPAVSAGWQISKESFMENVNWVQNLKLRAGWGATGNLPPYTMLYPSYSLYSTGYPYGFSSSSPVPGTVPASQFGNVDLKWESARQTNIGFDAGLVDNRVTLSADYYYKKVHNMIFTQQLPLTTGGKTEAVNLPGYDVNKGFEYNIDAAIIKHKDFDWSVSWNMSFNNNKMSGMDTSISYQTGGVEVGGSKTNIYTGIIKNGYSLGTFWGYKVLGIDQSSGNYVYSDNPQSLGSALPKYTFGFTNNFRYKEFTLSILIDGVHGNKVYNETRMETEPLTGYTNESSEVLHRWEHTGDKTNVPTALGNGTTNTAAAAKLQNQIASNYVEDGSFIRFRNLTLGYDFKPALIKTIGLSSLHLYATAQNLFIITHYKGYYPELNGFGSGTNNQAANAGSASSLMALGVDNGTYPAAKTFTVGLNVSL